MCSSTYMAFSQNTSHPVGRSPLWHFARTFLNFCHFEGVRMALGQTWFAHMQEPFTRIPNLVLTQKSHLAPISEIPRTQQRSIRKSSFLFFSKKSQHTIKAGEEKGCVQHSKIPFVDCKAGHVKLPWRGMQKFTKMLASQGNQPSHRPLDS